MKTSDFDYHLPESSIAQIPSEPRDSSRLLVLHRDTGKLEHRIFRDVEDYLNPGDLLVLNQTRVFPARIYAHKETAFAAAYEIVKERAIYRRERAVNLSAIAYVLSKIIILGMFAFIQVASMILILAIRVDMGFRGAVIETGALEMFVTMYLAVIASIAFGLFISSIVPSTDVVLYAILVQLFIQIILSGTLFPLNNNPASMITIGYWATDSIGSTVDLPQLNKEGRACSVVEAEIPSFTGEASKKEIRIVCDKQKATCI